MRGVQEFIHHLKTTSLGVLVDDAGEQPHAALVAPAAAVNEQVMNSVISLSGGLPFVALSPERAAAFVLSSMARPSTSAQKQETMQGFPPQFVSVEAREGISTGISAADRALTVSLLGAADPQPRKLVKPGHIFPVETREGGVLVKMSIPEAALDLVKLSGFSDAALYVDLLARDGSYLSVDDAELLAHAKQLPITTLTALIEYRLEQEPLITRVAEAKLPSADAGEVRAIVYHSKIHSVEHVALVKGDVSSGGPVLVRVQPENTLADVFGGSTPPSRRNLKAALKAIGERERGVLLYLRKSSLHLDDSQSHASPRSGLPRTAVMMREYGVGAQILRDLGVTQIEILTGTSRTMAGLSSFGIDIVSQQQIPAEE